MVILSTVNWAKQLQQCFQEIVRSKFHRIFMQSTSCQMPNHNEIIINGLQSNQFCFYEGNCYPSLGFQLQSLIFIFNSNSRWLQQYGKGSFLNNIQDHLNGKIKKILPPSGLRLCEHIFVVLCTHPDQCYQKQQYIHSVVPRASSQP